MTFGAPVYIGSKEPVSGAEAQTRASSKAAGRNAVLNQIRTAKVVRRNVVADPMKIT